MEFSNYLIYLSISVVASASIGPSVVLAANNGIHFGLKKALAGVCGHVSAILLLALVSASGVGAIMLASPTLFLLIKYLGVGYLAYVGISIWRSKGAWSLKVDNAVVPSGLSLYRKSLLIGLSNPKALVFFTALFPQFIHANTDLFNQLMLLIGTSLFNAFIFTFGYALLGYHCKHKLMPLLNNGWLGRITGSIFLSFSAMLAVAR